MWPGFTLWRVWLGFVLQLSTASFYGCPPALRKSGGRPRRPAFYRGHDTMAHVFRPDELSVHGWKRSAGNIGRLNKPRWAVRRPDSLPFRLSTSNSARASESRSSEPNRIKLKRSMVGSSYKPGLPHVAQRLLGNTSWLDPRGGSLRLARSVSIVRLVDRRREALLLSAPVSSSRFPDEPRYGLRLGTRDRPRSLTISTPLGRPSRKLVEVKGYKPIDDDRDCVIVFIR